MRWPFNIGGTSGAALLGAAMFTAVFTAASTAVRPAPAEAQRPTGCAMVAAGGALRVPSLTQLQSWTRAYYPSLAAGAQAPARLIVGFVIDDQCTVRRHSAGFLPPGNYSEDVVLTLFPDLTRGGEPAGIGDALPTSPRVRSGRHEARLVVAWLMQGTAGSNAPSDGSHPRGSELTNR